MNVSIVNQHQSLPYNFFGADFENGNSAVSNIRSIVQPIASKSVASVFNKAGSFEIEFPQFVCGFKLKIVDIDWSLTSDKVVLLIQLGKDISLTAKLFGRWEGQENPLFYLENLGLGLNQKSETPIANFLTSTLWAMLSLSPEIKIRIPDFDYDLTTSFESSLEDARQRLEQRQLAYRLMVIEKALNHSISYPNKFIYGEEVEIIAYAYHSIVHRTFDWFWTPTKLPLFAVEENLSFFPKTTKPSSISLSPMAVIKNLFGKEINLGFHKGEITDAVIDNYEEAKEALLKLDGNIVELELRSLSGIVHVEAVDTPNLPQQPWRREIQKLIDLDDQLDSMLLDKYFNLAASTLEGLDENQKRVVTERIELNADIFTF
jgi:hypothetical protein